MSVLSDALFGRTRGAILSVLYGHAGESFYLRYLSRITHKAVGPVPRELRQLVEAGLVTKKFMGSLTLDSPKQENSVFEKIRSLVAKTVGVHDVLLEALDPVRKKIHLSFVFGSVARSGETKRSDLDLMIIGKTDFQTVGPTCWRPRRLCTGKSIPRHTP